ncbi:hypothetical protein RHGRI_009550 [Rhododendron griersonianum]|uniref:Receptor-like serine/threonine-protein kinase n=1 Tax=Rhododendron griersonianum TaxID=479676 RepID=A0AAV6KFT9_9ERIC|nr:hypothetical protein RHGRI_009550 [Rhododendron griersonianum]
MKIQAFLSLFHAFFFSSAFLKFSIGADTLGPNKSFRDGETLVSTSRKFELGFFSPGSSKNRYLGIWYVKNPETVVWVANRNNPINDSKGVLTISSNKTLVLFNGNHSIIWSSNSSSVVSRSKPFAKLLDSGNFLLIDAAKPDSNMYLWQSFDYPGDTRLVGMKLGQNLNTGLDQHLTSWRTAEDPSLGEFTYRIENHGLPQLVINKGSTKKYRSGPWNGLRFSGLPRVTNPANQPILEFNENKLISLFPPNNSFIKRSILSQSGFLQHYSLNGKSNTWELMYTAPNDLCDNYGHCGPNGFCPMKRTSCECLKGFTPKSQQEWEVLNWSNGCVRSVPLDCQKGEGFVKVAHVKLPDLLEIQLNTGMGLKECEHECLKNCSCIAYANSNISEGGSGCLMWLGDLIDTREFFQGGSEQEIYIRLPASAMSGIFELGFFSPGTSKNRYVGIWYKEIPNTTVVWVANRETPLLDTSGVLKLKSPGILVLVNGTNDTIWSTNTSRSAQDPVAQLLDLGNMVVRNSDDEIKAENFLWQSFDYPGNTLLSGMKLGKNLLTGQEWYFSSWKSDDDPGPGVVTFVLDTQGYPQTFLRNGATELYGSGPWNGSGCLLWFGNLIDIKEFIEGGGQDIYVRMASSESEGYANSAKIGRSKTWRWIIIALAVSMTLLTTADSCMQFESAGQVYVGNSTTLYLLDSPYLLHINGPNSYTVYVARKDLLSFDLGTSIGARNNTLTEASMGTVAGHRM